MLKLLSYLIGSMALIISHFAMAALVEGGDVPPPGSKAMRSRVTNPSISIKESQGLIAGTIQSIDLKNGKIVMNHTEMAINPSKLIVFANQQKSSVSGLKAGMKVKFILSDAEAKQRNIAVIYY